jgi:hypothetical protein
LVRRPREAAAAIEFCKRLEAAIVLVQVTARDGHGFLFGCENFLQFILSFDERVFLGLPSGAKFFQRCFDLVCRRIVFNCRPQRFHFRTGLKTTATTTAATTAATTATAVASSATAEPVATISGDFLRLILDFRQPILDNFPFVVFGDAHRVANLLHLLLLERCGIEITATAAETTAAAVTSTATATATIALSHQTRGRHANGCSETSHQ